MPTHVLPAETLDADLHQRIARYGALDLVQQPVWIYDFDRLRVHWANAAALKMWKADSLHELCSRDMGADMSASSKTTAWRCSARASRRSTNCPNRPARSRRCCTPR